MVIGRAVFGWGFVAATALWTMSLFVATLVASRPQRGPTSYVFSVAVYLAGSIVCHQRPERSFQWWGAQAPVCARCVGIYAGAALAALLSMAFRRKWEGAVPDRARLLNDLILRARVWLVVALAPTALTLVYEWVLGEMPAHWVRAASGAALGAAVAFVIARVGAVVGTEST